MSPRSTGSSSSSILLVLILIITFPFWIAAFGIVFGVLAGVFGAMIGAFAAIFGVFIAVISLPFKILFGWGDGGWFPHFHFHGFFTLAVIVFIVAVLLRNKK